ncbi:AhpC/TSA family protein [Flavobacteriales bacterium]|nr:AhpC/TSA family protein [Flavobacteriales bacterium]MDC3337947.1 AhpC/TSA family protein [Flavobacteriales bacterium]
MIKFTYITIALLICPFAIGQEKAKSAKSEKEVSISKQDMPLSETNKENNVFINGVIQNANGKTIYLSYFNNGQLEIADSCNLKKNGKFELATFNSEPDFYRVGFTSNNFALLILSKDQKVTLNGDADSFKKSYSVKGSLESEQIKSFVLGYNEYNDSLASINKLRTSGNQTPEDQKKLSTKMELTKTKFTKFRTAFIDKNYNNLSVLIIISNLDDIKDYDQFKKIEAGLGKTNPDSKYYTSVKQKVEQIEQKIKQEEELKKRNATSQPGKMAPALNFPGLDGEVITLESLRGKYVLIDFWASWCRPCRMENPNVVQAYNKYKEAGFTVFSVSLDRDKNRWEQAIIKDGLVWPNHVSDLKQWQSAAVSKYGFRGIPHTVLIDKEGRILEKNLRGQALENKLEEIFGF